MDEIAPRGLVSVTMAAQPAPPPRSTPLQQFSPISPSPPPLQQFSPISPSPLPSFASLEEGESGVWGLASSGDTSVESCSPPLTLSDKITTESPNCSQDVPNSGPENSSGVEQLLVTDSATTAITGSGAVEQQQAPPTDSTHNRHTSFENVATFSTFLPDTSSCETSNKGSISPPPPCLSAPAKSGEAAQETISGSKEDDVADTDTQPQLAELHEKRKERGKRPPQLTELPSSVVDNKREEKKKPPPVPVRGSSILQSPTQKEKDEDLSPTRVFTQEAGTNSSTAAAADVVCESSESPQHELERLPSFKERKRMFEAKMVGTSSSQTQASSPGEKPGRLVIDEGLGAAASGGLPPTQHPLILKRQEEAAARAREEQEREERKRQAREEEKEKEERGKSRRFPFRRSRKSKREERESAQKEQNRRSMSNLEKEELETVFKQVTQSQPGSPSHPVSPVLPTSSGSPSHPVLPTSSGSPSHPVLPTSSGAPSHPVSPVQPTSSGAPSHPVLPTSSGSPSHPILPTSSGSPSHPVLPTSSGAPSHPVSPVHCDPPPETREGEQQSVAEGGGHKDEEVISKKETDKKCSDCEPSLTGPPVNSPPPTVLVSDCRPKLNRSTRASTLDRNTKPPPTSIPPSLPGSIDRRTWNSPFSNTNNLERPQSGSCPGSRSGSHPGSHQGSLDRRTPPPPSSQPPPVPSEAKREQSSSKPQRMASVGSIGFSGGRMELADLIPGVSRHTITNSTPSQPSPPSPSSPSGQERRGTVSSGPINAKRSAKERRATFRKGH